MTLFKNLIGGQWVTPTAEATFESRNPANPDDLLGVFPMATLEETRQAIAAAQAALPAWAATPAPERGAILDKVSQIIAARLDDMATMLTREEGKTRAEATAEMIRTRDIFRYYSGEGWRPMGQVLPGSIPGEHLYTQREPLGVVSIITPWNFPAAIPAWKIAPALAFGNTVVFKPATDTPRTGLLLVEAMLEAGLPPGVINFVTGSGRVVGGEMSSNPGVNGISFTGSYQVGSNIYSQAVKNMTRVQLEMGGKNPLVVLNDANLELAVSLAVKGGFGVTGQACTASSRVIVEEGIADDFAPALAEAARGLVVGNGLEENTQMGPAASQPQLETDLYYTKLGRDEGAKLLAGGDMAKDGGYFVQPTVFDGVETSMRIAQEEIFGPVISIIRAKNLDDAIEKANDIGFGLSAGIATNDMQKAFAFANRIEAGVVKINEPTSGIVVHAPFGGFKHSSANTFKEQGYAAVEFFTRTKTVYVGHG
jgi:aldehyde dehydrogenase (NAD+)